MTDDMLLEGLREWLPRQRWFGGKGRSITAVTTAAETTLLEGDPRLEHRLLSVDYADGGTERYQVLLGVRRDIPQHLEYSTIAPHAGGTAYDAAHDSELTHLLLQLINVDADEGPIAFRHLPGLELLTDLRGTVMGAEQSNTSVVFGDEYILKLFRKIAPGLNPDLEVTRALAEAQCTHIAPPLGWLETTLGDEPTTLGMMQPYFRSASEGWALAVTSVRDLYAEGDLHADEVGGDFAGESHRLGLATAEVHRIMAEVLPSHTAGPDESALTGKQMHERLDAALQAVPELAPFTERLRGAYDAVASYEGPVPVQRVHGDFHLGQVLRTDSGWVLLDFEGEPARPLAERTALMSPLRDVAGMLRSFDYAARHLLAEQPTAAHLAYRATEWAERNREAFCDGYAQGCGRDPREDSVLLRAFELDKAVYEVVYEARNRPTWLPIPLGSIERLVG
jgi:maltokinase